MNSGVSIPAKLAEYLVVEAVDILQSEIVSGYLPRVETKLRDQVGSGATPPDKTLGLLDLDLGVEPLSDRLVLTMHFPFGSQGYLTLVLDAFPTSARWSKGDD